MLRVLEDEYEELRAKVREVEQERDEPRLQEIPQHVISERHIRYHETPILLVDLLEVVGVDGATYRLHL
jgi:hypothetical protein